MQQAPHGAPRVLAVNVGSSSLRIERWTPPATRADTAVTAQGIGGDEGTVVSRAADGERQDRAALPDHRTALEALLPRFGPWLEITLEVSEAYARIKATLESQGNIIPENDLWIAGSDSWADLFGGAEVERGPFYRG